MTDAPRALLAGRFLASRGTRWGHSTCRPNSKCALRGVAWDNGQFNGQYRPGYWNRDLLVRISGYSAYFVELIERTEHPLG